MSKANINGRERDWEKSDIVQIVNPTHQWFPALIVVSEARAAGILGYTVIVENSSETNGNAYIRLKHDDIELVGRAVIDTK